MVVKFEFKKSNFAHVVVNKEMIKNDQILLSLLQFKQYLTGLYICGLYYKHIFIDLSQFKIVKVGKVLFALFDCQNWLTLLQLF
jgi:hypothetical protein